MASLCICARVALLGAQFKWCPHNREDFCALLQNEQQPPCASANRHLATPQPYIYVVMQVLIEGDVNVILQACKYAGMNSLVVTQPHCTCCQGAHRASPQALFACNSRKNVRLTCTDTNLTDAKGLFSTLTGNWTAFQLPHSASIAHERTHLQNSERSPEQAS